MVRRKWLIITVIAVSLLSGLAGILKGGGFLPLTTSTSPYAVTEKPISEKTETMVVEHLHDGLPTHRHIITLTTTVLETTPHGSLDDLATLIPQSTTPDPAQPTGAVAQSAINPVPTVDNATKTTVGAATGYRVLVNFNDFMPGSITVPPGATVTWTNVDNMEHTIIFDNGLFDSRLVAHGSTGNYTFTTAGTFGYHCDLHPFSPGEVGEVIVK